MMLLIALFCCHYLADFTPISTARMLAAKKFGRPFTPILVHGHVHGSLMFLALLYFNIDGVRAAELYMLQTWTHAGIDLLKGRCNGWFPALQNAAAPPHWMVFGADQLAHTLIILFMWHLTQSPQ